MIGLNKAITVPAPVDPGHTMMLNREESALDMKSSNKEFKERYINQNLL